MSLDLTSTFRYYSLHFPLTLKEDLTSLFSDRVLEMDLNKNLRSNGIKASFNSRITPDAYEKDLVIVDNEYVLSISKPTKGNTVQVQIKNYSSQILSPQYEEQDIKKIEEAIAVTFQKFKYQKPEIAPA